MNNVRQLVPGRHQRQISYQQSVLLLLSLATALLLSACTTFDAPVPVAATATPVVEEVTAPALLVDVTAVDPLPLEQASAPVRLEIPALNLAMPVEAMTWTIATVEGERTTKWIVPDEALGWHVNSAGAGGAGNTILSGHQAQGAALLAPLALEEVVPGQEILLTDEEGVTFVYQVRAISKPIPINGASEAEVAEATAYVTPGETAQLTLVTGWPDFTTTHRLFAQADFLGVAK